MKYFLLGYMASGKTTVGRELADLLQLPFFDLDKEVEKKEKKTVAEIFDTWGEDYFRKCEHKTLVALCKNTQNVVIALGGGTPCFLNTMTFLNRRGVTIYLKTSPQELAKRLRLKKKKRPILRQVPNKKLESFIENHLSQREICYDKAILMVDMQQTTVSCIASMFQENS